LTVVFSRFSHAASRATLAKRQMYFFISYLDGKFPDLLDKDFMESRWPPDSRSS
jgi:hypothetical protein